MSRKYRNTLLCKTRGSNLRVSLSLLWYLLPNCKTAHEQLWIRCTENCCKYAFVLVAISSVKVETLTMPLHASPGGMLARKMQALARAGSCVCACIRASVTSVSNAHGYNREVTSRDTKVPREKKIHLGRIDQPRSAKAYDFGNSLAVFQSFFGQSTSLIVCKTHGNLSIYSLEPWPLEILRPARLIRINGRTCNYCVNTRSPIRRRMLSKFVSPSSIGQAKRTHFQIRGHDKRVFNIKTQFEFSSMQMHRY